MFPPVWQPIASATGRESEGIAFPRRQQDGHPAVALAVLKIRVAALAIPFRRLRLERGVQLVLDENPDSPLPVAAQPASPPFLLSAFH